MATTGTFFLIMALLASLYCALAFTLGAKKPWASLGNARASLLTVFGLVSASVLFLLIAILTHSFQLQYVANYTSRSMSLPYLISALWAGNSGSLLFWAWLLSLLATILVLWPGKARNLVPYASAVNMLTEAFFLILLLFVSSPFQTLSPVPADGTGLNPMLENPGMIFHPPTLLSGYVSFTIPFALTIAALLTRKLSSGWWEPVRNWALLSWLLLGIGNLIGAWWAYVELGWGGYWAWDPVENAGLMPWLVITAFLHSIMLQRRKGMFKTWNVVMVILAFNFTIFGTFLTRSNILSSVHTFGESGFGPFFTVFLLISFFGPLLLLYNRSNEMKSEAQVDALISREGTFQIVGLLFVGAAFITLIGTVFGGLSSAFGGTKVTVGESFFNRTNGPLFLAIVLLAGLCTAIGWRRMGALGLVRRLTWPLVATALLVIILIVFRVRELYGILGFAVSGFAIFTLVFEWLREARAYQAKAGNLAKSFWQLLNADRARYGGRIIHIGIILITIGVVGSHFYGSETQVTLKPGESTTVQDYRISYIGMNTQETPDKTIVSAPLEVSSGGQFLGKLTPEKQLHRSYEQPVTEVAIRSNLLRDLYVILAGWKDDGTAIFRVLVNPLVSWLWIGGAVLVIGGLLAFWPSRRATEQEKPSDDSAEREIEANIERQVEKLRRQRSRTRRSPAGG